MQKKRINRQIDRKIPPFHTLLIEQYIEICQKIKISLLIGSAQIFGIQLKKHYPHYYSIPCSIPVYTWQGAQIRIQSLEYENTKNSSHLWLDITQKNGQVESAPMIRYMELHCNLVALRKLAFEEGRMGPRVAVVGGELSGAQNVARLLLNYSGKFSMNPIYVDLDPENAIFIDGSIGALEFQYKIIQDLYDRPNKICFYYGNRSIKSKSYLTQVKYLAESVMKKQNKEIKDYKMHGSKDEYPTFAAGLIIQCPKYKAILNKKQFLGLIRDILGIFQCTHVVGVGFPELESSLVEGKVNVETIKGPILEGTESFLSLPRPLKSKIQRYFANESIQIKYPIGSIRIYQMMTQNPSMSKTSGYCRVVNIRQQAVAKNTVAILHAVIGEDERAKLGETGLYQRALTAPIACLARIFNIGHEEIVLEVGQDHFLEEFRNNIWVTSVSDQ